MEKDALVAGFALVFLGALAGSLRSLHKEGWQIVATLPRDQGPDGSWRGVNLTYYGLITSSAAVFAMAVFALLMRAIGVQDLQLLGLVAALLIGCTPCARLLARWVEGKSHTLTVMGVVFAALWITPCAIAALNAWLPAAEPIPLLSAAAALSIAYVIGEGLGRLACISFGCCYGRPIADLHPRLQPLFARFHVVFQGRTKKIAYASGLDGVKVVPIQAMTSIVYLGAGLAGLLLFLHGDERSALFATLGLSQLWRVYAETLRADHRGGGRLSAYQQLGLGTAALAAAAALWLPEGRPVPMDLARGLSALWNPVAILLLQTTWFGLFLYTGWSMVTGSVLSFHVHRDRV